MTTDIRIETASCRDTLDWLDGCAPAMIDLVRDWSAINSGSDNRDGLAEMGARIDAAFAPLGAELSHIPLDPAPHVLDSGDVADRPLGRVHRFVRRPDAPRRVLLTGHIDTVFSVDHPFQQPRLLDDNTLNGPGVADMKGGLIVMLHALLALERSPQADKLGWEVLISPDEEIGSPGSAAILADRAPQADIGLTYEPALADGTLAGARKGSGNFALVVSGRSAHAGREFDKGRNAIVAAAGLVRGLDALNGQRDGVTVNVAVIHGGVAPNIVPDRTMLRVNARAPTAADARWVESALQRVAEQAAAGDGIEVAVHGGFNRPPKPLSADNERLFEAVAACGAALGLDIAWRATGGCCEGNNLAAAGLPNVDTLGVRGGNIHSPEEYCLLDSFAERARLSALIMLAFADDLIRIGREAKNG